MEYSKSIVILALFFTTNVSASVFNTFNNINYEWLELSQTAGLSRNQIQAQIDTANPGDVFYGYEYASRKLVEDLLFSYLPLDGSSGFYGGSTVITGVFNFFDDFGTLNKRNSTGSVSQKTVDGYTVNIEKPLVDASRFFYGRIGECSDFINHTCDGNIYIVSSQDGTTAYTELDVNFGWSSIASPHVQLTSLANQEYGSLLVKTKVVPIPATIWLFTSGLIGFLVVAGRKRS